MPNLGAPSTKSTTAWLEQLTSNNGNYFTDEPLVILDALPAHFAPIAKSMWGDIKATLYRLPAASGKWLNPCDQAINREMRRTFLKLQRLDRSKKLENIIAAYYSISEEVIKHSFQRCGIFTGDPEEIISAQASQGFHATLDRKEKVEEYKSAFCDFLETSVRSSADLLPRSRATAALDTTMDGCYWTTYGSSPVSRRCSGE